MHIPPLSLSLRNAPTYSYNAVVLDERRPSLLTAGGGAEDIRLESGKISWSFFRAAFHRTGKYYPFSRRGGTGGHKIELENDVELHLNLFCPFYYVEYLCAGANG